MNSFLLRISMVLPKTRPAVSIAPTQLSRSELQELITKIPNIHLNASILRYIRDSVSAVRLHPLTACGLPPRAAETLALAVKAQVALRGSRFAIPEDITCCVIEVFAHRIIVAPSEVLPAEFSEEHPVYLAREIVAAAVSSVAVIR